MQPKASETTHSVLLADLLGRISAELTDLAAAVERMHPLASAHARTATALPQDAASSAAGSADASSAGTHTRHAAATATSPAGAHSQHVAAPTPAAAADTDYVQALQDLDHTEQKLRALAGFLADIAQASAPGWRLDPRAAIAAITLADLAARLAGHTTAHPAHDAVASGELELF